MGSASPQGTDILEPVLLSENCKEVKRTICVSYSTSPPGRPCCMDLPFRTWSRTVKAL